MDIDRLWSLALRTLVLLSLVLLVLPVLEKLCNIAGYTVLRSLVAPIRLMEYAAILLLSVMALLLRQIRDELRAE